MGQDYRLKKLYEQMLTKQTPPQSNSTSSISPRTLSEAYSKTLIAERQAFYAKEVGDTTVAPPVQGLEALGVSDNPTLIRNTIISSTIKETVDELFDSAGEWKKASDYDKGLKIPLSMQFAKNGLKSNDLAKIVAHKKELTSFSTLVSQQALDFDMSSVVVQDLKKLLPSVQEENLLDVFEEAFNKRPKISDISSGEGEVALSLFTDCKKAEVGDLESPIAGKIEIKCNGARLGDRALVNVNYAKDISSFLKELNVQQKTHKELNVLKNITRSNISGIMNDKSFQNLFTKKLWADIQNAIDRIGTEKFEEALRAVIFRNNEVAASYKNRGYFAPVKEYAGTKETIHQHEQAFLDDQKSKALALNAKIKDAFAHLFASKTEKGIKQKAHVHAMLSQHNIEKIEDSISVLEALNKLYFTDFGLTDEQKAEALCYFAHEDQKPLLDTIKSDIVTVFRKNKTAIETGSSDVLKGLFFALQVFVYGNNQKGKFNFLVAINNSNYKAVSFKVDSFSNLFDKFLEARSQMGFGIDAKIEGFGSKGRGVSQIKFS